MKILSVSILLASLFVLTPDSYAHSGKGKGTPPTKEQRVKMAENMEKMAACLKSDKDMKDCRKEMKKSCEADAESCPMMKHRKSHHKEMKDE